MDPNDNYHPQNPRLPGLALALGTDFGPQPVPVSRLYVATDEAGAVIPHPAAIGRSVTDKERERVLLEVLVGLKATAKDAS
ncbi:MULTISPECIES: hypothetical protein [unclassified Amycolatopsis]|uniref:hypothetical protein n=1 Tax=unclassified Amycolatopsis TaxID=2618356 RepID=UPI0028766462|nr:MULTISPECIES: hypothetical protein [unclassified Amycolatopsis]MDS0140570.1 hypothetical protein [Amycolatopsis sp. 505]MDS0149220.1 hypothetical protein [Amycolatopsis sp. CM201R]